VPTVKITVTFTGFTTAYYVYSIPVKSITAPARGRTEMWSRTHRLTRKALILAAGLAVLGVRRRWRSTSGSRTRERTRGR